MPLDGPSGSGREELATLKQGQSLFLRLKAFKAGPSLSFKYHFRTLNCDCGKDFVHLLGENDKVRVFSFEVTENKRLSPRSTSGSRQTTRPTTARTWTAG